MVPHDDGAKSALLLRHQRQYCASPLLSGSMAEGLRLGLGPTTVSSIGVSTACARAARRSLGPPGPVEKGFSVPGRWLTPLFSGGGRLRPFIG
jgi:hypothetical protein